MKLRDTLYINIFLLILFSSNLEAQIEKHSFSLQNVSLRSALDSIMHWYYVNIVYIDKDIEGKTVTSTCKQCYFDEAINSILQETQLQWMKIGNQIIIKLQEVKKIQQFAIVSGIVKDSITSEQIVSAIISIQEGSDKSIRNWCLTNAFGFYSLPRIPLGMYTISIRAIGYESISQTINITSTEPVTLNFSLRPKEILMSEVTIEGKRTVFSSAETFSRGIYFRSIPSDQCQYLLDGGRIYNPTHFGGVLTTFNTTALNDVQVALGGLPPFYGGKMGGIIDLSLRNGNQRGISSSTVIGSHGASFTLDGPIDNNTTYLISSRKGYPDATVRLFNPSVTPSRMNSFELTTKINHRLSGSDQLSLSGFWGHDSYLYNAEGAGMQLENIFRWENRMLNLRWNSITSPSLFLYSSLIYSRYDLNIQHKFSANSTQYAGNKYVNNYFIEDINFRAHAENYYDNEHTIRGGVEIIHYRINGNISELSTQNAPFNISTKSAWEISVYLQDQWKILSSVLAEIGARATTFTSDKGTFSSVDPRFSILKFFDEQTRAYMSVSAINQFIHPYRNSGVFILYPTYFFYPSTEKIKPTTSLHGTIGIQRETNDNIYRTSIETYYRITNNLHEFYFDTLISPQNDLSNLILSGTSKAYGLTCKLEKRLGNLTGSITYNLSWIKHKFPSVNNGNEFTPPFDRRHEIQFSSRYALSAQWIISLLCIFTSGQSYLVMPKITSTTVTPGNVSYGNRGTKMDNILSYNEFLDVNGSRLPGFQRLEISLIRKFNYLGISGHFSVRLLNSYGLIDPFKWELNNSPFLRSTWSATFNKTGLFPLYPSLELMIKL